MTAFRFATFIGIVVLAMTAVQATANFGTADPLSGALFLIDFEPSLPVLIALSALVPIVMMRSADLRPAPRRRRVNRARLRARRAAA